MGKVENKSIHGHFKQRKGKSKHQKEILKIKNTPIK